MFHRKLIRPEPTQQQLPAAVRSSQDTASCGAPAIWPLSSRALAPCAAKHSVELRSGSAQHPMKWLDALSPAMLPMQNDDTHTHCTTLFDQHPGQHDMLKAFAICVADRCRPLTTCLLRLGRRALPCGVALGLLKARLYPPCDTQSVIAERAACARFCS